MPRAYLDKYGRHPILSNERGVGIGMANDRADVMLVQLLLRAIMHSGKTFLGNDIAFTQPVATEMGISGAWDEASKIYLTAWEHTFAQSRAYWAYGNAPATLFPGTVVPFSQGGKKIKALAEMCVMMFGKNAYETLSLPNAPLPQEVAKELFWT